MSTDSSVTVSAVQMQAHLMRRNARSLEVKRSPSRNGWTAGTRRRFAAVVRELREQRHWSTETLSERSGVPLVLLINLEEATSPDVGLGDVERLARAFEMPVREFIGAITDRSRPARQPPQASRMTQGRRSKHRGS